MRPRAATISTTPTHCSRQVQATRLTAPQATRTPRMIMLRRIALRQARRAQRRRLSSDAPAHRPSRANRRAYLAGLRDRRDALEAAHGAPALHVATAVERTPVVMPDPEDWELEMWELQARLEEFDGFDYPPSVLNAGARARRQKSGAVRQKHTEEILAPRTARPTPTAPTTANRSSGASPTRSTCW